MQPSAAAWRLYAVLAVLGSAMVLAMFYILGAGTRMSRRHVPQIDAAVQIQLEATTAHLWFEEILSGDRLVDMDEVWRRIDAADRYAAAMLDGGEGPDGVIVPLEDPRLRAEIEEVRRRLEEFRRITHERWETRITSAAGSDIDQRYDEVFVEFVSVAKSVEVEVQQQIRSDLVWFRRVQISVIVGTALLAVLAGVVIARYVERRSRAEELLQRSEEELRMTFAGTPIPMAVLDRSGRFVRANPACRELLGYGASELSTLRLEDITHPDDAALDVVARLLGSDGPHLDVGSRLVRKDGGILHGLIHARRVPGAGKDGIVVCQIVDRTRQVEAEEEARRHREQLAHVGRVTAMGEMAAGMAHEINQPLTAITTFVQACRRLVDADRISRDELSAALRQVSDQALRAGEVIRRLRGFVSRGERERETAGVNGLVEEVIRLLRTDARLDGLRIELRLGKELPEVEVDSVQIQQVVLNLVRNGLDAMREAGRDGGVLTVETTGGPHDVQIRVVDQGNGPSPEARDRLFSPFFTTKASGMGIGLSLSRSIVTAHGGRIEYEPGPSGGSVFVVTLPASDEARDSPLPRRSSPPRSTPRG